jgi:tetratricopeptide (TPR) repeat protein
MGKQFKKNILIFIISLLSFNGFAQTQWPNPEVEKMYKQAREFHSNGNLQQAIKLYLQALQIAPEMLILHRELAQAYYVSGMYDKSRAVLDPIIKSGEADEQTYQILAASMAASGEKKKVRNLLQKGIERFPHSGLLYHELGVHYLENGDREEALKAFVSGIEADPAYHVNYYEAARQYMNTNKPVWAILYAEIFINLEQQTPRSNETRTMLIAAYKRFFNSIGRTESPKYNSKKQEIETFETAVSNTLTKLSPIIADGFSTENLTMLRTRFIMDWDLHYGSKYPFSLFSRQDDLIRNGYFDIYNQWLFGKAENMQLYEAWLRFHPTDMPEFEQWVKERPYYPVAGDFKNDKVVKDIFQKN